jgi:VanZ family protein
MLHPVEMSRDDRGRRAWWVAAGLWAALIFAVSSIPTAGAPAGDVDLRGAVLHVVPYAVLAALVRRAGLSWRWSVLATVLYGLSDELHQAVVAGRDASSPDLFFDAVGALIGASLPVVRSRRPTA